MVHDGDQNSCVDDAGLMRADSGSGYDWSSCSRDELDAFIK